MYKINADVTIKRVDDDYFLEIKGIVVRLTERQVNDILLAHLPEKELVYSINTTYGNSFYSSPYPMWSIKSHPKKFVAGNIYFATKSEAQEGLYKEINRKISQKEADIKKLTDLLPKEDKE